LPFLTFVAYSSQFSEFQNSCSFIIATFLVFNYFTSIYLNCILNAIPQRFDKKARSLSVLSDITALIYDHFQGPFIILAFSPIFLITFAKLRSYNEGAKKDLDFFFRETFSNICFKK
jgi:hypothetical protein